MEICKLCSDPLVVELDSEESEEAEGHTAPDDLVLPCGCHFHWECLHDESLNISASLCCPSCTTYLAAGEGAAASSSSRPPQGGATILACYTNEGGVQDGLDIMPTITEEAYLKRHPEARPARALHVMCSEGDAGGIIELLQDIHENGDDSGADAVTILRYQDPLNEMRSGLHLAVEGEQEVVFWLLLWLASGVPAHLFPETASHAVLRMGVPKGDVGPGQEDIRFLKDERGRTAGDICNELGGQWMRYVEEGLFAFR